MKNLKSFTFKKFLRLSLFSGILFLIFTVYANKKITNFSKQFISDEYAKLPNCKVGLLLGTSQYTRKNNRNPYFFNRIEAAVRLFKSGKIKYILVTGDNGNKNYNEPKDMQLALIARGIPSTKIVLDYAGFRTLDSVIRALKVFGQRKFIVISQRFHNERAVYLARKNNIEAFGYNSKDVDKKAGFKTKWREFFARDKVFFDLLFGVDPKFLGKKVII